MSIHAHQQPDFPRVQTSHAIMKPTTGDDGQSSLSQLNSALRSNNRLHRALVSPTVGLRKSLTSPRKKEHSRSASSVSPSPTSSASSSTTSPASSSTSPHRQNPPTLRQGSVGSSPLLQTMLKLGMKNGRGLNDGVEFDRTNDMAGASPANPSSFHKVNPVDHQRPPTRQVEAFPRDLDALGKDHFRSRVMLRRSNSNGGLAASLGAARRNYKGGNIMARGGKPLKPRSLKILQEGFRDSPSVVGGGVIGDLARAIVDGSDVPPQGSSPPKSHPQSNSTASETKERDRRHQAPVRSTRSESKLQARAPSNLQAPPQDMISALRKQASQSSRPPSRNRSSRLAHPDRDRGSNGGADAPRHGREASSSPGLRIRVEDDMAIESAPASPSVNHFPSNAALKHGRLDKQFEGDSDTDSWSEDEIPNEGRLTKTVFTFEMGSNDNAADEILETSRDEAIGIVVTDGNPSADHHKERRRRKSDSAIVDSTLDNDFLSLFANGSAD